MYHTFNLIRVQSRYAAAAAAAASTSSSSALCFINNAFYNRVSTVAHRHDKYGTNRCYSHLSKDTYRIQQYVAFVRKTYNLEPRLIAASVSSSSDDGDTHLKPRIRKTAAKTSILTAAKHSIVEQHHTYDPPSVNKNNKVAKEVTTIDHFPSSLQPYLHLIRIDKPIGTWLLFWPCAWSIGLATSPGCLPDPYMLTLFGTGAFLLRSVGCIINDMWDRDIDAKVERTRNRPIASGQISRMDAFMFLIGMLALGDLVLVQLNTYCIVLGASSLGLVATYPLMKRITNWPQLFLGVVFNYGALMGWAAIQGDCDFAVCLPLYGGCISWTLIYDTIYAHQDKKDDALVGVKSTALHMGEKTKHYLVGFAATMVSGFIGAGIMSDQTFPYYIAVGLATSHILHQIITLDTNDAKECGKKFASNYLLGFIIMAGIIASTLLKDKKDNSTNKISGKVEIGQSATL